LSYDTSSGIALEVHWQKPKTPKQHQTPKPKPEHKNQEFVEVNPIPKTRKPTETRNNQTETNQTSKNPKQTKTSKKPETGKLPGGALFLFKYESSVF
jgi:hypothetical protein